MWSAPKQPFVLPVRIRSFEDLYKENVNLNAESYEGSPALEIRKKSEERYDQLAKELLIMRRKILSTLEFKEKG